MIEDEKASKSFKHPTK